MQLFYTRGFNGLDDKDQQEILNLIAFKKANFTRRGCAKTRNLMKNQYLFVCKPTHCHKKFSFQG